MIAALPGARHEPDLAIVRIATAVVMVNEDDACTIIFALGCLRFDVHADKNRGTAHEQNRTFIVMNRANVAARRIDEGHPELKNGVVVPDVDDLASDIPRINEVEAVPIGNVSPTKPILQRRSRGTVVRRHRERDHTGLSTLYVEFCN